MSSAKQPGVLNTVKKILTGFFRPRPKNVARRKRRLESPEISMDISTEEGKVFLSPQESSEQQAASESNPLPGSDLEGMEQCFPSPAHDRPDKSNKADEADKSDKPEQTNTPQTYVPKEAEERHKEAVAEELLAGGVYALQDQENGPYWLAKVIYFEEQVVHVVCYADRPQHLSSEIMNQYLTVGLRQEDSSFGIAHLPLPKAEFAAHAVFLGRLPLTDDDFSGYRIYVDSVFDCLDEQAPDWLKKAGSYAAWRYDYNAMAALVDRYLIGVDLPRDSRKSLYWLNRLVHAGKGLVQPEDTVSREEQILTGGLYACPQEEGGYRICKVVLKDKHGVQQLDFPSLIGELPEESSPVRAVEQASARRAGKPPILSHASLNTSDFLARSPLFLGLLPVTVDELHCYRAHLYKMFDGAEFLESAWEILLSKAAAGDQQAQMDVAYRYIDGDPLWEVQRNISEAISLLTEAANQGYGLAAYNLALLFQQGEEGIAPDPQLSLEWLMYSAQLNYGPAQLRAADSYRLGRDCSADLALSHAWYSIAVQADNDLSAEAKKQAEQRKKEIEKSCSAEQLEEAQKYFRQLQESF